MHVAAHRAGYNQRFLEELQNIKAANNGVLVADDIIRVRNTLLAESFDPLSFENPGDAQVFRGAGGFLGILSIMALPGQFMFFKEWMENPSVRCAYVGLDCSFSEQKA